MLNHTIVQGRLVADPELRTTQSGTSVCSFRLAWSEKYKETETKLFLSCTAWRGVGEMISNHFTKGKEIVVEGKLSTRDWEDRDGNKRQSNELTVERVHFCGKKEDGGAAPRAVGYPVNVDGPSQYAELEDDGELPF